MLSDKAKGKLIMTLDDYYDELEEKNEIEEKIASEHFAYGGGYEASKGDYAGACLARAEYEAGYFS